MTFSNADQRFYTIKKQKMPLKRDQLLDPEVPNWSDYRPIEDVGSFDEHMKALSIEMEKANPRDTVILPFDKVCARRTERMPCSIKTASCC